MSLRPNAATLVWLTVLALAALLVSATVRMSTDLTAFMPAGTDARSQLLSDLLREGPSSRMLLIGITNAPPSELARLSQQLARALQGNDTFERIDNGAATDAASREREQTGDLLWRYRYLLSPAIDADHFSEVALRVALEERRRDLASPLSSFSSRWLAGDPTGEMLAITDHLALRGQPESEGGVWMSAETDRALLVAHTHASGLDAVAQQTAIDAIADAFARLDPGPAELLIAGTGSFAAAIRSASHREAMIFSLMGGGAVLTLLLLGYRSPRSVLLAALPPVTAVLAGLACVNLLFGNVHGITLAFGVTLVGVAIDYPLHVISHSSPGQAPAATARRIWPTLRLGVASTLIAYATLLFSGFPGLIQLGAFTVAGLGAAGLVTRYWLPRCMVPRQLPLGWVRRLRAQADRIAAPTPLIWALAGVGLAALVLGPGQLWQDDLASMSPLPEDQRILDTQLRAELGAPDARFMLAVPAADQQQALQASEALMEPLQALVDEGALGEFEMAARYLPSQARQRQRQASLPPTDRLENALERARSDSGFRAGQFEPFLDGVEQAATLPVLSRDDLTGTWLETPVDSLLLAPEGETEAATALIPLSGVTNPQALRQLAESRKAWFFDLKGASESLVAGFRDALLWRLGAGALGIALLLALFLRPARETLRVLAPVTAAVLLTAAGLHLAGIPLALFHLIALMLVTGLGLDYALFFCRDEEPHERARTLHALLISALSTALVFGILAASSIVILRAIGQTVAPGVALSLLLAALAAPRKSAPDSQMPGNESLPLPQYSGTNR